MVDKEIIEKEQEVRRLVAEKRMKGALLRTLANFAWLTAGGDPHVLLTSNLGEAAILVCEDQSYIIASNIESKRLADEEVDSPVFEMVEFPWYESTIEDQARRIIGSKEGLGSDVASPGTELIEKEMQELRLSLNQREINDYRALGVLASRAVEEVCRNIQQGDTENDIAARLASLLISQGVVPAALLVAADERIYNYRHPVPTNKKVERQAMVVLVARQKGLHVNLTRIVHFGPLPAELSQKHRAVVQVDATLIENTLPGSNVGDIFQKAIRAYQEVGYGTEWQLHHQGGATGYQSREYIAIPGSSFLISNNQAFAWNPSITGTKSEDTILVLNGSFQFITPTLDWPMIKVAGTKAPVARPDILVL